MEVSSPITKHSVGKTFLVSVGIVGLIALVELGAIAWAFITRFQTSLVQPAGTESAAASGAPLASSGDKLAVDDPLAGVPEEQPTPVPQAAIPRPTPVATARRELSVVQNRATELVQQARAMRDRGDTLTALTRLREAQAVLPDDPQTISEMAITYEKIGQAEKAREQWQRIQLMGEAAGVYFAAAERKLNSANSADNGRPGESPVAGSSASAAATEGSNSGSTIPKDASGFQPGSVLALADIIREDGGSDTSDATRFTLKIPVKSRPGSKIDVSDVVIQVFFYDLLDGQNIVQTSANVNSRWTTAPTDWNDDGMEILEVDYALPRPDVRDSSRPVENRRYAGYVARVYYKRELQDMRAEPIRLLRQFPPPVTLPSQSSR